MPSALVVASPEASPSIPSIRFIELVSPSIHVFRRIAPITIPVVCAVIIPVTLVLIVFILYLNTGSLIKTGIVLLAVPFSAVGAIWLVYLLGFNWSIAVWVGLIALAGLDAETGAVMLLYLDLAYERWRKGGKLTNLRALREAVEYGAVQRIRPKAMTVMTTFFALLPILWATGTGSDVMRRIAAPMIGGVLTSFVGELIVYPVVFFVWKGSGIGRKAAIDVDESH